MELHGDVPCAFDLEDTRRDVVVERDLAIRIVVRDHDVVLAAKRNGCLEIRPGRHRRRRVVRVVEIHEPGAPHHIGRELLQLEQETGARPERAAVRLGARQHGAPFVHGVAGLGHDRHIPGTEQGHREMRDPLLRAEQRVELSVRIDPHPKAAQHVRGRRLAERGQPELERVAAHRRVAGRARQSLHGSLGRREIRVPRPDIDDVHPLLDQPPLDGRDLGHGVAGQRRQATAESSHASTCTLVRVRSPFVNNRGSLTAGNLTSTVLYRPLPPSTALYRPLPLPPYTAAAPMPRCAKNSSQARRTCCHRPTTRDAGGRPSRISCP